MYHNAGFVGCSLEQHNTTLSLCSHRKLTQDYLTIPSLHLLQPTILKDIFSPGNVQIQCLYSENRMVSFSLHKTEVRTSLFIHFICIIKFSLANFVTGHICPKRWDTNCRIMNISLYFLPSRFSDQVLNNKT